MVKRGGHAEFVKNLVKKFAYIKNLLYLCSGFVIHGLFWLLSLLIWRGGIIFFMFLTF